MAVSRRNSGSQTAHSGRCDASTVVLFLCFFLAFCVLIFVDTNASARVLFHRVDFFFVLVSCFFFKDLILCLLVSPGFGLILTVLLSFFWFPMMVMFTHWLNSMFRPWS